VSRSSNDALAVGFGACEVAVGTRRAVGAKWAACGRAARVIRRGLRGRAASIEIAPDTPEQDTPKQDTPAAVASPHRMVEVDAARRYTDEGALDALRRALADTAGEAPSKRCASVVLDDFWGHHAIMQGDFRVLRTKDIDEVAGAYFADTFGIDAQTLAVRWQLQPGGRALFASALPRSLIEGIRAQGAASRVDVTSITLALPQMLNRVRSAIAGGNGWLLVVTDTLLHAVTIGKGGWSACDSERLFRDAAADAAPVADAARQMFERSAAPSHSEGDVYLCGLALDPAPFERSFTRVRTMPAHMSDAAPALRLMELAP
jgi:hypothetical protein